MTARGFVFGGTLGLLGEALARADFGPPLGRPGVSRPSAFSKYPKGRVANPLF